MDTDVIEDQVIPPMDEYLAGMGINICDLTLRQGLHYLQDYDRAYDDGLWVENAQSALDVLEEDPTDDLLPLRLQRVELEEHPACMVFDLMSGDYIRILPSYAFEIVPAEEWRGERRDK